MVNPFYCLIFIFIYSFVFLVEVFLFAYMAKTVSTFFKHLLKMQYVFFVYPIIFLTEFAAMISRVGFGPSPPSVFVTLFIVVIGFLVAILPCRALWCISQKPSK